MSPTPADLIQKASELLAEAAKMMREESSQPKTPTDTYPVARSGMYLCDFAHGYLMSHPHAGSYWTRNFQYARRIQKQETAFAQLLRWQELGFNPSITFGPVDLLPKPPKAQRKVAKTPSTPQVPKIPAWRQIQSTAALVRLSTGECFNNPLMAGKILKDLSEYVFLGNPIQPRYAIVFKPLPVSGMSMREQIRWALDCRNGSKNHFHNIRFWQVTSSVSDWQGVSRFYLHENLLT